MLLNEKYYKKDIFKVQICYWQEVQGVHSKNPMSETKEVVKTAKKDSTIQRISFVLKSANF